ncbi:hypothetical protein ACIP9C_16375 [Lysinibacillus sp. NPDC093210]|uniref:hypothetical protein n=1 Tax=Lysinibacillus sp. NPDC093210 TaxID=3364133 RepID=UPI00382BB2A7
MSFFGDMMNKGLNNLRDTQDSMKAEMERLEFYSDEELKSIATDTSAGNSTNAKNRRTAARMVLKQRGY